MLIIKVPFSGGSLGKNEGCEKAPDAVMAELNECYLPESFRASKPEIKSLALDNSNIDESFMVIEEFITTLEAPFVLIGGDHSITFPAFKGLASNHPGAGLIILDAHADAMNDFVPPTHEDFVRVLVGQRIIKPEAITLVGLRNLHPIELDFLRNHGIRFFSAKHCFEVGLKSLVTGIMEYSSRFPALYLSIDIDVVDPAFASGTGYPEPGGFTSREIIYIIQRLRRMRKLIGVDIVEINPKRDASRLTARLGARLLKELLSG